jgi:hypothetical protein
MATVQYYPKENKGHKFWTARHGRYSIRIDANRPGVYLWLITAWRAARSAKVLLPTVMLPPTRYATPWTNYSARRRRSNAR